MADNVEKIVIGIDETDAVQSAAKANRALEEVEKTSTDLGKSFDKTFTGAAQGAKLTVMAVDRTAASVNRLTANFEKRMAFAGMTGVEKTLYEADALIKKVGQDSANAARIQAAAVKEVARQEKELAQLEEQRSAKKLQNIEKERKAQRTLVEETLAQARYQAASAVDRLRQQRSKATMTVLGGATSGELVELNRHFDALLSKQQVSDRIAARNKLAESLRSSAEAATLLATRFLALEATGLAGLIWLTKTAASLERTQTAFNNLLGSKQAGEAFFGSLLKYSRESVFALDDIARSGQKALARGFNPEQAERVVKISYATAAAMGQQAEAADRLILALSQIQAKQRVSAEEMNQLAELGVQGWKALADAAGIPVQEVMAKAEKGMLNANVAVRILTESMAKNIAIQKQIRLDTVSGQWAGLRNELDQTAKELDKDLLPAAKATLDVAKDLGGAVKGLIVGFSAMPTWIKATAAALLVVTTAMAGFTLAISGAMKAAAFLFAGTSAAVVGTWAIALTAAAAGVALQFLTMKKAFADFSTEWERVRNKDQRMPSMEASAQALMAQRNAATTELLTKELQNKSYESLLQAAKKSQEEIDREREQAAAKLRATTEQVTRIMEDAQEKSESGFIRIQSQYQQWVRIYVAGVKDRVTAENNARMLTVAAQALGLKEINKLAEENHSRRVKEIKDQFDATMAGLFEMNAKVVEAEEARRKIRGESFQHEAEMLHKLEEQRYEMSRSALEREKSLATTRLEAGQPLRELTLREKVALEEQKFQIEKDYVEKSLALQRDKLRAEQMAAQTALLSQTALDPAERSRQAAQSFEYYEQQIREMQLETQAEVEEARLKSVKTTNDMVVQDYKRHFDQIKSAASTLLDQLLSKTKSWGDVFKAILKAAILTPIKEAAATWIATVMTPRSGGGGAAGGGFSLGGLLGGVMGGSGSGPFGAPAGSVIMNAAPGGFGGAQSAGSIAGIAGGLKTQGAAFVGLLRGLGGLGRSVDILGNKVGSIPGTAGANAAGVGGAAGGAMLLGGGALAAVGLYRGGWSGVGMAAGGGALIGGKFFGVQGAVIGAGIGAAAGLIRMMFKSAEQKTIEKIKQVYGISVDKPTAKMFMEMAKSSYGGNIDMAIRSPQGREWVELYSMSTGQTHGGMPRPMYGVSYAQSGGQVNLQPVYSQYGQIVSQPYSGPTPSQWSQSPVYVQLDPKQANDLLEGRMIDVMTANPEVVSNAATSAGLSGVNRSASRVSTVEPLTTFA